MLLQQMTEVQQRGRVWYALDGQIDTHEVAHRLTIVDRIFERLVGERIPLLQEVDPQHALQADGRTAALFGCLEFIRQRIAGGDMHHGARVIAGGENLYFAHRQAAAQLNQLGVGDNIVVAGGCA